MSRFRRRKIIRAGWLVACVIERIGALFLFFFGTISRFVLTTVIVAAAWGMASCTMNELKLYKAATPDELRHFLTSNSPRTNACMIDLMPRRMIANEPVTVRMLTVAVKDCELAIKNTDEQAAQRAIIKSLETKR